MVRLITLMLKREMHFKWTPEAEEAFVKIKDGISFDPVLSNPNMSKDLIMYVFSSDYSIVVLLTQKDADKRGEHSIAFHSKTLKEYEAKYNFVEKQALAIVKFLKKFRHFIAYNKTTMYVTHPSVGEYIMEGDIIEKRENWITKILEYDIDVRPTKVIHGKGLCEYIAQESDLREAETTTREVVMVTSEQTKACWIENRKHFMKTGIFPADLPLEKKRF
ncbi:uncharacterized protein LOC131875162 [Cryptomeria japonica]|uniref:uncharacterized protein LOC131875162 n=1 Tax=Cryptomeria japonica TaxID=3369 RepID=UPI0027DA7695|nr:uncharacterized protein LOC131875162 [Cryptomeria japonica]